jgi:site-specific DNA-cytosine methylase
LHGIQIGLEAWKGAKTGRKVPGLIVFENVPRIMTRGKKLLEYMVALLHAEGYAVEMSTHDCGELGKGLAQRRRRFLLVARHMATVTDFLRKPPQYKPLALRDILWELPPPRPGGKGMHTLPVLSALNHLRLAAIFAGKDWRVLPPEVYLYTCESSELEAVTGIRWEHCAGRHAGKLGVLDWSLPAKTIIGKARVCTTWGRESHRASRVRLRVVRRPLRVVRRARPAAAGRPRCSPRDAPACAGRMAALPAGARARYAVVTSRSTAHAPWCTRYTSSASAIL